MSDPSRRWPEHRFSQAVSEGDGISIIPLLRGELEELARVAEEAGAEALAVEQPEDVARLRAATDLPVLVRHVAGNRLALERSRAEGADACVVHFDDLAAEEGLLEELAATAWELGLELAIDVRDEEELAEALERLDPDILLLSERNPEKGELELDRTLDLLADVPAGKLVVSESRVSSREQVLELERAGVDGVLFEIERPASDGFAAAVAELAGRVSAE